MTLYKDYNKNIPEYYNTMYMDGYSPEQILHAARRKMIQNFEDRQEAAEPDASIVSEVNIR